jgi:hypothetical protein
VFCCGFDNLTSFFLEQIDDDVGHDELRPTQHGDLSETYIVSQS